jgi:hypothetical protein
VVQKNRGHKNSVHKANLNNKHKNSVTHAIKLQESAEKSPKHKHKSKVQLKEKNSLRTRPTSVVAMAITSINRCSSDSGDSSSVVSEKVDLSVLKNVRYSSENFELKKFHSRKWK